MDLTFQLGDEARHLERRKLDHVEQLLSDTLHFSGVLVSTFEKRQSIEQWKYLHDIGDVYCDGAVVLFGFAVSGGFGRGCFSI
jgi:hypothetical protein